jgi:Uma2 family endonuclease
MGNRENTSSPVRLTYADLRRLPDDGMRHELIDGEHYVTPAPRPQHQRVSFRISLQVGMYLEEHPLGRMYYAPLDVFLTDFDCVEPDLLYVSREREQRQMTEDYLEGAPDLVVEILSPSTKRFDHGVKHRLYERFGVSEYWIVDPEKESVRVYRQEDDRLQLCEELLRQGGASAPILSTSLLPGLAIPLDKIFD